jgi:DNA-binding transcriptional LysR family regulator
MLTDNKIDMAILTRTRGIKGKFIRSEPMCWATIADSDAWSKRPLPVALFEVGCACRIRAEQALKRGNLPYRIVCSSPSMTGLVTTVEAGLAVAALARCSVPKNLKVIGRKEGLPDLERLEILIGRSTRGKTTPCEVMEELIEETLTQPD